VVTIELGGATMAEGEETCACHGRVQRARTGLRCIRRGCGPVPGNDMGTVEVAHDSQLEGQKRGPETD
jgi:hypothetical protein